ncbi:hypothetical protein [Streptomyces iconiensis]|uniref:Secreted protein n=1 Tax=Streptomyces iconiensis TaxID=1384038 RepID=A0ABT6ZY83_9ACTN|nr:hypothetical protein [Streptomyces iconiensis]MDJ1134030.1 hypothetical protein [Streptomyces iconiensis]
MNRPLRITLFTVLAVALVAAGAVGGALYAHEDPKEPKKFSERTKGSTCWAAGSVLDRLVPASPSAESSMYATREELQYDSSCLITADGKQILRVSVKQQNSVQKLDRFGTGAGHGKTKSIPGFEQGWSSRDVASVAVPCTKNTGDDNATNLYVKAQAWGKNYPQSREDMVRIVKQAVKKHRHMVCVTLPTLYATS